MKVVNLASWSGDLYSYQPGAIIDNVPDDIAKDRIAAGYMRLATESEAAIPNAFIYPAEAEAKHNEAAAKADADRKAAEEAAESERAAAQAAHEAKEAEVASAAEKAVQDA